MKEPAAIGKTTISVNQGKKFVVKTRYTWPRKTRARNSKIKYIRIFFVFFEYGFLSVIGKKKKKLYSKRIQVGFSGTYQYQ